MLIYKISKYTKEKGKKQPQIEQKSIDNNNMDIAITGIKLKYLSEKNNDYGTNHFFELLDEKPLQELIELGKDMRMPVWEYDKKHYSKVNGKKCFNIQLIGLMKMKRTV